MWRLTETFRIGRRSGPGPDVFGSVAGLEVDPRGRVYVADRHAHEVRVFDAEGRHMLTFGGEGDGPGEFRMISGIARDPGGTLWVKDPLSRLTGFDTAGVVTATAVTGTNRFATIPWAGRFDSSGDLYDVERRSRAESGNESVIVRHQVSSRRTLRGVDTLPLPPVPTPMFTYGQGPMGITTNVPFAPFLLHAVSPEGTVWLAYTKEYRLHHVNFQGDTLGTIELRQAPPRVTSRERDSVAASSRLRPRDIPKAKPAIRFFTVADNGRLWVKPALEEAELSAWDVFEADGTFLGRVLSPVQFTIRGVRPIVRGDTMIGVVEGSLGVQSVVGVTLERQDAG